MPDYSAFDLAIEQLLGWESPSSMPIPSTIGNVSESNENITLGILSFTVIIGSTHDLNA